MQLRTSCRVAVGAGMLALAMTAGAGAQPPNARTLRVQDTLQSPVLGADGQVTFQLYAPKATQVTMRSEGPAPFAGKPLAKADSGVWTLTVQVPADLYIYWFDVARRPAGRRSTAHVFPYRLTAAS